MTIDLTGLATSVLATLLPIIATVFLAWLRSHMKDQTAATTIGNAVNNALGAVQQAADAGLKQHPLQATLPVGTSPLVAAGVAYVLQNAGPEATRLGITPDAITSKIEAKLGLQTMKAATAPVVVPVAVAA